MDRTTVILIIAKNGLDTAALVLTSQAAKARASAATEADAAKKAALLKHADRLDATAKALNAADTAVNSLLVG